jgi:ADP-ribosyl-[dinitrogen reductase] hydrolase
MFFFPDRDRVLHFSGESSRTTHGAAECLDACRVFGDMLRRALVGASKQETLFGTGLDVAATASVKAIARGEYRDKTADDIHGTGYVVQSLEAALWCFLTTETFKDAVLKATNLGDDADTTAAICGQIAGAYYGESGIPTDWLEPLAMREEIGALADQLHVT